MLYIAGTGTRAIQTESVERKNEIIDLICGKLKDWMDARPDGVSVISGMAEGFDSALAQAAILMELPLICCIPNPGYGDYYWGKKSKTGKDRSRAFNIIKSAAIEIEYTNIYYSVGNSLYKDGVHMNFWRNQRMVDRCDVLFAWATGPTDADGGTSDCIKRALAADLLHIEYLKGQHA